MWFHRIDFFCPAADLPLNRSQHTFAQAKLPKMWRGRFMFGNKWTWEVYFPRSVMLWESAEIAGCHVAVGTRLDEARYDSWCSEPASIGSRVPAWPPCRRIKTKQAPLSTQNKHTLTPRSILAPISAQQTWRKWQTECLYDFPQRQSNCFKSVLKSLICSICLEDTIRRHFSVQTLDVMLRPSAERVLLRTC